MARPEGFEPPTNGFGSHYSIRLSYRRVVRNFPLRATVLRGGRAARLREARGAGGKGGVGEVGRW